MSVNGIPDDKTGNAKTTENDLIFVPCHPGMFQDLEILCRVRNDAVVTIPWVYYRILRGRVFSRTSGCILLFYLKYTTIVGDISISYEIFFLHPLCIPREYHTIQSSDSRSAVMIHGKLDCYGEFWHFCDCDSHMYIGYTLLIYLSRLSSFHGTLLLRWIHLCFLHFLSRWEIEKSHSELFVPTCLILRCEL